MVGPERFGVQLEDEVVRRVGDAVDLLQNDVAFRLEIALPEQRVADQIGEDLDRQREVGVEDVGLVAGVVAAGEGIETAAPDLQLQRQLAERCDAQCP